jgi:TatD DNase family protein
MSAAFAQKYPADRIYKEADPADGESVAAAAAVYAGCGIHPDDVGVFEGKETSSGQRFSGGEEVMGQLRELCGMKGVVCVGEIGLDYHWMVEEKEVQRHWFRQQMCLAHELGLPINVHSRDAAQDTYDLIRETYEAGMATGGVIHCYSGSLELAWEYVKMGYHIGIGGVVTFKNAKVLKRVAAALPLGTLVTETDCPYLAPEPNRGTRNDSLNIRYVIEQIAALREMDPERCADVLRENAHAVYRI